MDEFNILKDGVKKRLEEHNAQLRTKCECLEKRVHVLQPSTDDLELYDWRNNLIWSVIPDSVSDDDFEEIVTATLSDIDKMMRLR